MTYRILMMLALLVCGDGNIFARDNGGRCSICGKLTFLGSSHDCKPRKRHRSIYVEGVPKSKSLKEDNSLQDGAAKYEVGNSSLPVLRCQGSRYRVLGVQIDPMKDNPQLLCEDLSGYGASKCSFDIGGYSEEVTDYYNRYRAHIPVMGVKGMNRNEWRKDPNLNSAVEQLRSARSEAERKNGRGLKDEKENFRMFHTPLKCLATYDAQVDCSKLSRKWKNKRGMILDGVWIANYRIHHVDGIVISIKGKKKLLKVPMSVLCDEDVSFIQKSNAESEVQRFDLRTLNVKAGSDLAERFERVGETKMKLEAVVFANGQSDTGAAIEYVQLCPSGQICEWPISASATQDDSTYVRRRGRATYDDSSDKANVISAEIAAKGPVHILETMIAEKAEKAAEKEAARIIEEKERPFRIEYALLQKKLQECAKQMERYNPELRCEIHKWKEVYAPKFGADAYTEQQKTLYGANYQGALKLQQDGILKCSCKDDYYKPKYDEACERWKELRRKEDALIKAHPEINFTGN